MYKFFRIGVSLVAVASLPLHASAWEATRSVGPMPKIADKTNFQAKYDAKDLLSDNAISFDGNLTRRVVPYPYSDGASLGQGWDFITNTKRMSSCINFKAESDLYQEATYELQQ